MAELMTRRALRTASGRDRVRRQRRGLVLTILGVLGTTILGVSAAGGTYAFLNDTAFSGGGTISAGTADLQIKGAPTATLDGARLDPATENRILFDVANTGDVTLALSAAVRVTSTPAPAIAANTRILVARVDTAAECSATKAPGGPRMSFDAWNAQATTIGSIAAQSAPQLFCLILALAPETPATQSGQSFTYTLTINGRQTAP